MFYLFPVMPITSLGGGGFMTTTTMSSEHIQTEKYSLPMALPTTKQLSGLAAPIEKWTYNKWC